MWHLKGLVVLAAVGIGCTASGIAPAGEFYRGYAYAPADHRLLYTESHWQYQQQGVGHRLVIYSCPDGKAFARKWVDNTPGASIPDLDMLDGRTGYREGVRSQGGQREVYFQPDASSPSRQAPLEHPPDAVIDAGFDAFVREHWDELSTRGVDPLPFLILSQLRYLQFSAKKLRDSQDPAGASRWFRLQLSGWYAFALPHIDVSYDVQTHDLLAFQGISNIRGSGGHNLSVAIEFPPAEHRHDSADGDLQQAAARPVDGRCLN
jgi:hypothetical protein